MVPWVCLKFVIVVFPDHTHLLFFVRDYARNIFRFDFLNDDVCFFVWIYEIEQFKLKVGRCFALISNQWGI